MRILVRMVSKYPRAGRQRLQVVCDQSEIAAIDAAVARDGYDGDRSAWIREAALDKARKAESISILPEVSAEIRRRANAAGVDARDFATLLAGIVLGKAAQRG
ncbi:MAG: hypothetical protein V2A73_15945 [Pseudomonadota bacterium]